ncbi:MAG: CHASE2 domain-containing protein [Epsilonproteobacteria bacterium]|nr:CHASE2 domain-containing protein [Campylobacterota bacterium]
MPDGVLRRVALFSVYKKKIVPSFALAMLLNIDSNLQQPEATRFKILNETIRTDTKTNLLLNLYEDEWYRKVSAIDMLKGNVAAEMLRGKIAIIGSSAVGLHDQIIVKAVRR